MYAKLAFRNIRRSLRDYIIYFVTLTLTAALMYSFLALGLSPDILAMTENMSMLTTGILILSALIAFNVKSDPLLIGSLRGQDGYFPAYHMNKEKWLSIQLGKPELDDAIKDLLSLSYELTAPKKRNSKSSAKNPGDSANGKEKETDEG